MKVKQHYHYAVWWHESSFSQIPRYFALKKKTFLKNSQEDCNDTLFTSFCYVIHLRQLLWHVLQVTTHSSSTFLQYREKNSKFSYNLLLTVGFFDHSSLWQIFTWLHAATSSSLLDTAASVTAKSAKKCKNSTIRICWLIPS